MRRLRLSGTVPALLIAVLALPVAYGAAVTASTPLVRRSCLRGRRFAWRGRFPGAAGFTVQPPLRL